MYKYIYPSENTQINKWYIHWRMTDWCNYNCPYCIQTKHYSTVKPKETQEMLEICAKSIRNKIKGKLINMSIMGGEVSYFDLNSICKILLEGNDVKGNITLTTNLSYPLEKYIDFYEQKYKNMKFKINASYHWRNKESFLEKAKVLSKYKSFLVTSVVTNETKLSDMKKTYSMFAENTISFKFVHGREPYTKDSLYVLDDDVIKYINEVNSKNEKENCKMIYDDGKIKTFKHRSNLLEQVSKDLNLNGASFKNMICFSGTVIYPSQEVYCGSCGERRKMYKGKITDSNVTLSPTKKICKAEGFCNLCDSILIWSGKY